MSEEAVRQLGRKVAQVQTLYHDGLLTKQQTLEEVDRVVDAWLEKQE